MSKHLAALSAYTYEVRHNPNCPSPFCIVTCGDLSFISRLPYNPENLYSYGRTLDEAARNAVTAAKGHAKRRAMRVDVIKAAMLREQFKRFEGIVWG